MRFTTLLAASSAVTTVAAGGRLALYFDQWHTENLPTDKSITAGVTHVIVSFATSSTFQWGSSFTPFMPVSQVRSYFDANIKVCMAIGGWGDTTGFSAACKTEESRNTYAKNVASAMDTLGFDCVDVDWEYPGGNGQDYKQTPNSDKVNEIEDYASMLAAIKKAIVERDLSIAVPGKVGDMIAFTPEQVPKINDIVDVVNVMAYDLMNRRDNETNHHSSVEGSLLAVNTYLDRGMSADKLNLGIAFYAKWFTTQAGVTCQGPTSCPTAILEAADGSDTGLSGAVTFEPANAAQFGPVLANGQVDEDAGGAWWWDASKNVYWTWDTPELVARKFDEIVKAKGLGGVMAWSLGEDTYDWALLKAMQAGVKSLV